MTSLLPDVRASEKSWEVCTEQSDVSNWASHSLSQWQSWNVTDIPILFNFSRQ